MKKEMKKTVICLFEQRKWHNGFFWKSEDSSLIAKHGELPYIMAKHSHSKIIKYVQFNKQLLMLVKSLSIIIILEMLQKDTSQFTDF